MIGIIYPDPFCGGNFFTAHSLPGFNPYFFSPCDIPIVQLPINVKKSAQLPRPIRLFHRNTFDLNAPDQHGRRKIHSLRHDVETVVHAVNEIDVCMTGFPIHYFCPFRSSFAGMAGQIVFSDICLHLGYFCTDNFSSFFPDKKTAKQILGYSQSLPLKKSSFKNFHPDTLSIFLSRYPAWKRSFFLPSSFRRKFSRFHQVEKSDHSRTRSFLFFPSAPFLLFHR